MSKIEHNETEFNVGSLRGKVFNLLQNDILNGVYQTGDSLVETKLSEELGVSRTPIREAIRQLELEGLVQSIPNKGTFVKGISAQDIEDIYTIRMLIEGLAARWATEKVTDAIIKELKEVVELEEFYTSKNDVSHLLQYDTKFHDIIFKASKSMPLMHTLSAFHNYIQRARNMSLNNPERANMVLSEHKSILQAIIEKDASKAERLTTEHVRNAKINLLKSK